MILKSSLKEQYRIRTVEDAKFVAGNYLAEISLSHALLFGLPEIDDRFDIWRVPLKTQDGDSVGEVAIDAVTTFVIKTKTTSREILENRLLKRQTAANQPKNRDVQPKLSTLRNTIGLGDSEDLLRDLPNESIDLIFTSPPYYNARPEYAEYIDYAEYLLKMRKIIHEGARVLNEGRFFIINLSPVLIRRSSRGESSKRIAVPFDFHALFIKEGFEFIDDIIWVKPEGAGWASGRGRRFAADRNPLQYKPVPVTEYVLVYRKATSKLIDWHIRKHPDQEAVRDSKIEDGYEITNIWKIPPAHSKIHPAVFPLELAKKVITYYSFKKDVVLDPFAGIGTTALAAIRLGRRFAIFEQNQTFLNKSIASIADITNIYKLNINWINIRPELEVNYLL